MKNKTSFRIKAAVSRFYVSGLLFSFLLLPSIVFGQSIQIQADAVSSVDVWSTGVILRGTTSTVNYRWFEFGPYNTFTSFLNSTPKRGYDSNTHYVEKITGLSPDTSYVFRGVVEINGIRYNGSTLSFKTKRPGYSDPTIVVTSNYSYNAGNPILSGSGYQPTTYNNNQNTNTGNNNSSNSGSSYNSSNSGSSYNSSNSGSSYNSSTSGYLYNSYYSSSVVTKQADFLSYTSARLNANLFPSSEYNVYGWYEWGMTTNLENSTARVFVGKGPSLYFGQTLNGLIPGTVYYFKPVVENAYGSRIEGTMLVFKTPGVSPYPTVTTTNDSGYSYQPYNSTNNSVKTNSSYGSTGSVKTATVDSKKTITIGSPSKEDTVASGEIVSKKVLLENMTGEELSHVSVRVILPEGETFASIEKDKCKEIAGQVLFCEIGKMSVGQKNEIAYELEVANGLNNGTSLEVITVAAGEYKDGRRVENFNRSVSIVDASKEKVNLTATALFGSNNSSLKDLFMFIEFILLLVLSYFVWKHLSEKNEKEKLANLEAIAYLSNQEAVVPKKQSEEEPIFKSSTVTEKGIPPTNLPI